MNKYETMEVKSNLLKYYIKLCNELKKRFDFIDKKIELPQYLNPIKIQECTLPTIIPLVNAFPFNEVSVEVLNSQWRSLMIFSKKNF